MPSSDSLTGLMKWLRREPWGDAFHELLDRHVGPACDKADVPFEELDEVIGPRRGERSIRRKRHRKHLPVMGAEAVQ